MTIALATREGAERFMTSVLEVTRDRFLRDGALRAPEAFIFATRSWAGVKIAPGDGPKIVVCSPGNGNGSARDKDLFSYAIRRAISATKAIGVLFVTECRLMEGPVEDHDRLVALKTIEHEPGRKEAVFASLEHIRLRSEVRAIITRDAAGKPTLGAFEPFFEGQSPTLSEGRFFNLLDRERFA